MLRLHGFAASHYHDLVKVVLLEKGLEFEEVISYPPADEAYKALNPTGKYPCLETEDAHFLGESRAILDYLEEAHATPPLLPAGPFDRARAGADGCDRALPGVARPAPLSGGALW